MVELPLMWTAMTQRGFGLERISEWMAAGPAKLAGLSGKKGALVEGADADILVFDPNEDWTVSETDLHFRHKLSPYVGTQFRGKVRATWLRGEIVYSDGRFHGSARGRELVNDKKLVK